MRLQEYEENHKETKVLPQERNSLNQEADRIKELENLIQIKDQMLLEQAREIEDLRDDLSNSSEAFNTSSHQTESKLTDRLSAENQQLIEDYNVLKLNYEAVLKKVAMLEQSQTGLEQELNNRNADVIRLESANNAQRAELNQLRTNNVQQFDPENEKMAQAYQKLKEEKEILQREMQARIEALEKDNQTYVAKNRQLEQNGTTQQDQSDQKLSQQNNARIRTLEDEKRVSLLEAEKLRENERALVTINQKLKFENESLKQKSDQSSTERHDVSKLNHQNMLLEATIQNYESDLAKAKVFI